MPQVGESVAARTARSLKAGTFPLVMKGVRMSCVVGQKAGRSRWAVSLLSSIMYSMSSSLVLRQAK